LSSYNVNISKPEVEAEDTDEALMVFI